MIIDIRSKEEYEKSHMKDAISIPYETILLDPSKVLEKNKKYYLYCNTGKKSKKLVTYLNNLGYNTVNIEGGYWNILLRKEK